MRKALVIDDDKLIRWSLQEIFTQEGHEVDAVATEADALSEARKSRYQVIFADFEINNKAAIEMLRALRELQPEAAIVVMSGMTRSEIESQLNDLAIHRIIEKPFDSDDIRSIARDFLG